MQPARGEVMAELELSRLEDLWGYARTPFGPQGQRIAVLTDENNVLGDVLTFADAVSALDQRLKSVATMPAIDLRDGGGLARLQRALDAVDLQSLQDDVQARTERTKELLATSERRSMRYRRSAKRLRRSAIGTPPNIVPHSTRSRPHTGRTRFLNSLITRARSWRMSPRTSP